MTNDLVDLVLSSSGQVLDELLVDRAVAKIRGQAGWHIAPVRTETLMLNSWGDCFLAIPSLRILSVSSVRFGAVIYTGFTVTPGGLYRAAGWPCGMLEVDLTHGYAECPPELVPLIVAVAENATQTRTPSAVTTGPFAVSYPSNTPSLRDDPDLERYTLPAAVA